MVNSHPYLEYLSLKFTARASDNLLSEIDISAELAGVGSIFFGLHLSASSLVVTHSLLEEVSLDLQ
jgi:hypothetical protein